jgi:pectate lyase
MPRHACITIAAILGLLGTSASGAVPAFPGARGFGTQTPGGRGGTVLFVTSLKDSGPRSLREAINASGPRIIVFRVGGTITLESPLVISNPYVTIAGQTAPGGGIQIRNNPDGTYATHADSFVSLYIRTHDVVIRHLRIRPGEFEYNPACGTSKPPVHPDRLPTCIQPGDIRAIHIEGGANKVVIDHVSAAWSPDDLVFIGPATNITLQWSIFAEGLDYVLYDPIPDSFNSTGPSIAAKANPATGLPTGRVTFHHNLFAHNAARTPSLGAYCFDEMQPWRCIAEAENNLVYNWRAPEGFGTITDNLKGHNFTNIVSNYYKEGPEVLMGDREVKITDWEDRTEAVVPNATLLAHIAGNRIEKLSGVVRDARIQCREASPLRDCDNLQSFLSAQPIAPSGFKPVAAEDVVDGVLAAAGDSARLDAAGDWVARRDAPDARVVADFQNGTGGIIDSQSEFKALGRWPTLARGTPPIDTDADGMPDIWETDQCLRPDVADDDLDPDGDVYTNLEEYLDGTDATPDTDSDGWRDDCDNCPTVTQTSQADRDGDGIGNACEPQGRGFYILW